MITALAHLLGAIIFLLCFYAAALYLRIRQTERGKMRILNEVALKIGLPIASFSEDAIRPKVMQFAADRWSNELMKNRFSDLCGVVLTGWGWLGLTLQIGMLSWALWLTFFESYRQAPTIWFALAIAVFFWGIGFVFSFLCFVLTGRHPGEARQARKEMQQIINS
jgi:hypothetical protein